MNSNHTFSGFILFHTNGSIMRTGQVQERELPVACKVQGSSEDLTKISDALKHDYEIRSDQHSKCSGL